MATSCPEMTIQICLNTNRTLTKLCKIKCLPSGDKFYKKLVQLAKQKLPSLKKKKKSKAIKLYLIETGQEITIQNITELISSEYAQRFDKTSYISQKQSLLITHQTHIPLYSALSIAVSIGEEYQGKVLNAEEMKQNICLLRHIQFKTQVSTDACKQLESCRRFKGMKLVVGQPDLHCGKGIPIGVSLVSKDYVYPHLIGTDIGCGMALVQTPISRDSLNLQKINRWIADIQIDDPWIEKVLDSKNQNNKRAFMNRILKNELKDWPKNASQAGIDMDESKTQSIDIHDFDDSLGTIGAGNHFAELQVIEKIVDEDLCKELGLNESRLFLMIHSGSRGFGAGILDSYLKKHAASKPLQVGSADFEEYIALHDNALKWARKNRMIIAQRFVSCMGTYNFDECVCHIDIYHNYLAKKDKECFKAVQNEIDRLNDKTSDDQQNENDENKQKEEVEVEEGEWYIHRKGAAPSDVGFVVIPGSRGSHSYIVKPNENVGDYSGYSLAHGAGRKLKRSQAMKKMSQWYPNVNVLHKTEKFGSYVICDDKALMYEEAPQAYKDITNVIDDLVTHNLITVAAILRPVITYKTKGKQYHSAKGSKHGKSHHHK